MTIFSAYAKCADAGALESYFVSDCGHILIRNVRFDSTFIQIRKLDIWLLSYISPPDDEGNECYYNSNGPIMNRLSKLS